MVITDTSMEKIDIFMVIMGMGWYLCVKIEINDGLHSNVEEKVHSNDENIRQYIRPPSPRLPILNSGGTMLRLGFQFVKRLNFSINSRKLSTLNQSFSNRSKNRGEGWGFISVRKITAKYRQFSRIYREIQSFSNRRPHFRGFIEKFSLFRTEDHRSAPPNEHVVGKVHGDDEYCQNAHIKKEGRLLVEHHKFIHSICCTGLVLTDYMK